MSYLQPCLLFMLSRGEGHGYSLLAGLDEFGFDPERVDASLVYRALRDMEDAGWVSSHWDDDSQGPRRRVYGLEPEGEARLAEWIADLVRTRDEINRLLDAYEEYREKGNKGS
jgi:DNA-binding PadR family transcriptional regulator